MKILERPAQVIIRSCDEYDPERIRVIIREAMEQLDLRPRGRTLVKPNVVVSGQFFEHIHTRAEFVEGVLLALRDRSDGNITELAVGERCGIGMPTRLMYKRAGYNEVLKRTAAKRYCFDEEIQVEVPLSHPGRIRDYVYVPKPVAEADFFVNCPKFKRHELATVTLSLKNYIGIQDDRHRLIDHDHGLFKKIADLQFVIQPELVVLDAIMASRSAVFEPRPVPLNLIIIGNNQVALDAVACQILGIDPTTVDHIELSHRYGFGPLHLDEIRVDGDVSLDEARERASELSAREHELSPEPYFETGKSSNVGYEGGHIHAHVGTPPGGNGADHCFSDCCMWFGGVTEYLGLADREAWKKIPRLHIVSGEYSNPIEVGDEELLLLIGDCASCRATVRGRVVEVPGNYTEPSKREPHCVKAQGLPAKLKSVRRTVRQAKKEGYARLEGCPASFGEALVAVAGLGGFAPPKQPGLILGLLARQTSAVLKRLVGRPYQLQGPCERGDAAPTGMRPVDPT